ncbi:uncharacterized protein A4U43_C03F24340 [Asparagus officinalis]|uniref:Replication protein A OB domain-containing protein n=1 Tax=Asparagus officinalis TaxID=4686 RepID=A0A5P1FCP4_ASPOF|nr:uncharacterized protein A4U43_C03F24340 [Asparagus officinalis]
MPRRRSALRNGMEGIDHEALICIMAGFQERRRRKMRRGKAEKEPRREDIIGIVKEIYPLELAAIGQKSSPRRSLKLIDESNAELKATLWNKSSVDLEIKLQNQDPNNMVMIVTGIFINTFRGNESFTITKLIEVIDGDSQESQEVELVNLHEEALLQTPKHISKDKVVFTPLTNTPLKAKDGKGFQKFTFKDK